MTSLFGSRRRAEDFAALVDVAAARAATTAGHDEAGAAPETESLLALVGSLRAAGAADHRAVPRPDFVAALREQLLEEAGTVLTPGTPRPISSDPSVAAARDRRSSRTRSRRERWLVAATTLAIMVGGSAGMATAAQAALPGEALYPVKRGMEQAVVTLSVSAGGRGRDLLKQAEGRLDEVHGLLAGGPVQRALIPGTLDTFHQQAREGADLMLQSYQSNDDPSAMTTLRSFAARSATAVASLADEAPVQAVPELRKAAVLVRDLDTEATVECPTCGELPAVQVPEVLLSSGSDGLPRAAVGPGASGAQTFDDAHPLPPGGLRGSPGTGGTTTGGTTTGGTTTGGTTTGGTVPDGTVAPTGVVVDPVPGDAGSTTVGPVPDGDETTSAPVPSEEVTTPSAEPSSPPSTPQPTTGPPTSPEATPTGEATPTEEPSDGGSSSLDPEIDPTSTGEAGLTPITETPLR